MTDIFENVAQKYKNTPSALVLFLVSFAMLIIGINHFAEDVYSSYKGLRAIEQYFHMNVQIFDWTYWTMSASAQVATIVYFYIYLANTDLKWALWVSVGAQIADFFSDVWYRSNGRVFDDWHVTLASALVTFLFFTVGSEVFITVGAGLCLKLAAPALHSWKFYKSEIEKVNSYFKNASQKQNRTEEIPSKNNEEKPKTFDNFQKNYESGQNNGNTKRVNTQFHYSGKHGKHQTLR